jgi:hypothetical protein
MQERDRPDLERVREALTEHDERSEPEPREEGGQPGAEGPPPEEAERGDGGADGDYEGEREGA